MLSICNVVEFEFGVIFVGLRSLKIFLSKGVKLSVSDFHGYELNWENHLLFLQKHKLELMFSSIEPCDPLFVFM